MSNCCVDVLLSIFAKALFVNDPGSNTVLCAYNENPYRTCESNSCGTMLLVIHWPNIVFSA